MLKIHILTDNQVRKSQMLAEHGLSLWIEKDDKRILFDTGQSYVFQHNAEILGLNLMKTDYIILSHGHYDHCGGLKYFPQKEKMPDVYAHPDIFLKKFLNTDHHLKPTGLPWNIDDLPWVKKQLIAARQPLFIENSIMVTGEIPRTTEFEEVPDVFLVEKNETLLQDEILDEQMLIIEEKDGLAVFLGCSHPGVINCLQYVQKLFPHKNISLLVAGMHLENINPERLDIVIRKLLDIDVRKVVPLHCTGFSAMCEMKRRLGDNCLICSVGDVIEI